MVLTHLDDAGAMRMVDVSSKRPTKRTAAAEGFLAASGKILAALRDQAVPKGDALAAARMAGITAVKQTAGLIPLCHPISITHASIHIDLEDKGVRVECRVTARDCTGVEMEALTGAAVACLTLYDMIKSMDKAMEIGPIRLLEKKGGRSGHWKKD